MKNSAKGKRISSKNIINLKNINWKILIISAVSILFTAWIGSFFMGNSTNSAWYDQIKPSITPPNIVFPIVWTILFVFIAIAFYFSLINSKGKKKKEIIFMYVCNFVFNILWSLFFFKLQLIGIALLDLIIILMSIGILINLNWKISKISSYLLIPYGIWVLFAGIINLLAWIGSI